MCRKKGILNCSALFGSMERERIPASRPCTRQSSLRHRLKNSVAINPSFPDIYQQRGCLFPQPQWIMVLNPAPTLLALMLCDISVHFCSLAAKLKAHQINVMKQYT